MSQWRSSQPLKAHFAWIKDSARKRGIPFLSARTKGGGGLGTETAGTLRSTDGGSDVDHALGNHIIAAAETGAGFWTDDGLARPRLTPEECELLQGFPIGYTLIPDHSPKKRKGQDLTQTIAYLITLGIPEPAATLLAHSPDGPRYKALGNSWAVPCARWIGQRIQEGRRAA